MSTSVLKALPGNFISKDTHLVFSTFPNPYSHTTCDVVSNMLCNKMLSRGYRVLVFSVQTVVPLVK